MTGGVEQITSGWIVTIEGVDTGVTAIEQEVLTRGDYRIGRQESHTVALPDSGGREVIVTAVPT